MSENTPPVIEVSNAFTRLLQDLNKGASLGDLSESMRVCVGSAMETGKAAEIKYTIKFTPQGDAMAVTDKIETKLPKADRKGAIFFPTEDNMLSRDNPEQRTLDLHEVPKPQPVELKEPVKLQAVTN
jgi:hypothetical protein